MGISCGGHNNEFVECSDQIKLIRHVQMINSGFKRLKIS